MARKNASTSMLAVQKLSPVYNVQVYPNPVSKGNPVTIRWESNTEKVAVLKLLSPEGRTILQQSVQTGSDKKTNFQLQTDARWSAGIYFMQLVCEKGRVLASEKIIIQ
jgi:hypothetical protein